MVAIDPSLRIRSVELAVSDLARSSDFYQRVLGLAPIASHEHHAQLGTDPEHPSLVLTDIAAPTPVEVGRTGLFHVAWLHPTRSALADSVRRVARASWQFDGAADHGVSEALYLSDPDGLGIELYVDRPRELWERPADGRGVSMVTLPLDLEDLLAQSPGEPAATLAPGTAVGHVHMKVADVERATGFYRDALGMDEQAKLPSAAFLSAGGYHHHVGLNSWQSRRAAAPSSSTPGLRVIEFQLAHATAVDAVERALALDANAPACSRAEDGALRVSDPDGQTLTFTS